MKQGVSRTLDTDMIAKLHILAVENDRSVLRYINEVLKAHLPGTPSRDGAKRE